MITYTYDDTEDNGHPWPYFFLILLNSGILFLNNHQRTGVPFVNELFFAMLILMLFWLLLKHDHWFFNFHINVKMLCYIALIFILPALFAWLKFGQPVIYGLMEERRTLAFLVFFPVFYGLCVRHITVDDVIRFIKISAVLCMLLSCLYVFGVLATNTNQDVAFSTLDMANVSESDLRVATRLPVGSQYVVFALLIVLFRMAEFRDDRFDGLFALSAIGYLYFIHQTRGILMVVAAVILLLLLFKPKFLLRMIIPMMLVVLLLVSLSIGTDILHSQYDKVSSLIEDLMNPMESRVRYFTSLIIFPELWDNYGLGMGSLSVQWQQGFLNYYNEGFYLSDVGMIGLFYRFGIVSVVVLFLYYHMFWSGMRESHSLELKGMVWIYVLSGILLFFYDSKMLWGGGIIGLLFAILYYEKYFAVDEEEDAVDDSVVR